MTDQRNRVTTDPGLGPIEREHASTLRSMTAADPIPEEEIPGTSVYFEPKPLHAVSEHKTLELETVKLAKDIDPRKLPTELKLRRPVLHVLPASDPNWPAPQADVVLQHDSNWPPPETTLTTSQFPVAARRRSFVPLVLLVLLGASAVLVLGARARHRSAAPAVIAQATEPVQVAQPAQAAAPAAVTLSAPHASTPAPGDPAPEASAAPAAVDSAELPATEASAPPISSAELAASAASARAADVPRHSSLKASPLPNANSAAQNASSTAKPKRAIY